MTEPIRLAKRVADLMACSRREAEQYIEGGFVRVNGQVVQEPQARVQDEEVVLDPHASLIAPLPVTLLWHKPADTPAPWTAPGEPSPMAAQWLSAEMRWPQDRMPVQPLKRHFSSAELLTPLATPASGLVVFSQDWRVARKLREDALLLEHEVVVQVGGTIKPGGLERLNRADHGFTFQGVPLAPAKVSWQSETRLRFALKGERAGQIAFLCDMVGLQIESMKRLRIGRVSLAQLPVNTWRYLRPDERF